MDIADSGARVLELVVERRRQSTYDQCYVARAERLQTTKVTVDERLLNAVGGKRPFVQPLWEVRLDG